MLAASRSNWLLKSALIVMSVALALLGILGWADKARLFEAVARHVEEPQTALAFLGLLDPLWPFMAVGGVACGAAQIIAACGVVNFARLRGAGPVWRGLAIAFYLVGAVFAAWSADEGAKVIMSMAHRAAYEQREAQRQTLTDEIAALQDVIADARARIPDPAGRWRRQVAEDRATFESTTAVERARLPLAQAELAALAVMQREAPPSEHAGLIFVVFIAWGVLEPWGYALAERGGEAPAPAMPQKQALPRAPRLQARFRGWLRPIALLLGIGALAAAPSHAAPVALETAKVDANTSFAPPADASQRGKATPSDAKTRALSLRGHMKPCDIAALLSVHQATIYRWFQAADRAAKAEAALA